MCPLSGDPHQRGGRQDGCALGAAGKETVITDTVAYRNLVPGCEYTVRGWLMVKETGQEFLMGEEPVVRRQHLRRRPLPEPWH